MQAKAVVAPEAPSEPARSALRRVLAALPSCEPALPSTSGGADLRRSWRHGEEERSFSRNRSPGAQAGCLLYGPSMDVHTTTSRTYTNQPLPMSLEGGQGGRGQLSNRQ